MDADKHIKLKSRLMQELGEEALQKMTGEIIQIIGQSKLDNTPVILEDYLTYLKEVIHLQKI